MIVTLDDQCRVGIPAEVAPTAPGDKFDASFDAEEGVVLLRRVGKADWLEVLKSCPVPPLLAPSVPEIVESVVVATHAGIP